MSLFQPHARSAFFDYYTTTIRVPRAVWKTQVSPSLDENFPRTLFRECTPAKPFKEGAELIDRESEERRLLISMGGDHVKDAISLRATGKNAPALHKALTEAFSNSRFTHFPSRIDSAIDWFEDGLYDTLQSCFRQFALDKNLKITMAGDWERNEGRTLYIGSRNAPLMVRLYEKGYEQRKKGDPEAPLNWVRFEVEAKYKKASQRLELSKLSPSEIFQLGWVSELCSRIMFDTDKLPMPSTYHPADFDRTLTHVKKQYRALFLKLSEQCSTAADWEKFLLDDIAS